MGKSAKDFSYIADKVIWKGRIARLPEKIVQSLKPKRVLKKANCPKGRDVKPLA